MIAHDNAENDPLHHVAKIMQMLEAVLVHCRDDTKQVEEPKAQALFQTTAQVLSGLKTGYRHYASATLVGGRG